MNPEQWLSLKWNGGSTMSDRWLNQSKIIHNKHKPFICIPKNVFASIPKSDKLEINVLDHSYIFP